MIRLDQVGSTAVCAESTRGVGVGCGCSRGRVCEGQAGLEIAEPTDSLSTLSGRYYEANVRPTVAEYLDPHPLRGRPFPSANSSVRSYLSRAPGSQSIPELCLAPATSGC